MRYILIILGIILVAGLIYVLSKRTGNGSTARADIISAGSSLQGNDATDYAKLAADLKSYMNCAEDGGVSERCAPNWRDNGATRDTISTATISSYQRQLESTEYSNDNIRRVAGRNLIYHWRYQLKAKNEGRTISNKVYEALFADVQDGLI